MASGRGSNAGRIISYFRDHHLIRIALVVSNNASAPVLEKAEREGVPVAVLPGSAWDDRGKAMGVFEGNCIDAVVLAGYMKLIPSYFVQRYHQKILNIHPALLPEFGGKGMYGMNVHRKVIESGAKYSGITIHLVNEEYDSGPVLFQARTMVRPEDTPESLAERIRALEHEHYPRVIEDYLCRNIS